MKCNNPEMEKMVSLYQFNMLSRKEKNRVEAHILECDICFADLYQFYPALEILQETPEKYLDALTSQRKYSQKILYMKNSLKFLQKNLISNIRDWWEKPAAKYLIPVAATIMLAIFLIIPSSGQYSDLAIINKESNIFNIKGQQGSTTTPEKLFSNGMEFYESENYDKTITKLTAFLIQNPDDLFGHFYLGISFLLENKYEDGIKHLTNAAELSKEFDNYLILDRCYWLLGNAYLKTNEVENALSNFKKIIEINGKSETNAQKQIAKIEQLKTKKEKS